MGDEAKYSQLRIRLTEAERAELDRVAHDAGKGTSTWARDALLDLARDAESPKRTKQKPEK
jgi:hypothetical protein